MGLLKALRDAITSDRAAAIHYRCRHCDREFVYRADLSNPACPYCDAPSLEPVDGAT